MGIETINDPIERLYWKKFIEKVHTAFSKETIPLKFEEFKKNGSYGKAKSGTPAVKFVFAKDKDRKWVEVELKSRTSKGEKYAQTELYHCLKNKYMPTNAAPFPITWNEEDLRTSPRHESGLDVRIKTYLQNPDDEEWLSAMIYLAKGFLPLLHECK